MGKYYKQGDQCILDRDSNEYYNMERFCKMLNRDSPNKHIYVIKDVYLDYGQHWMWTNIIDTTANGCQVLNPREWFSIVNEEIPLDELEREFFDDKYCQDKADSVRIYYNHKVETISRKKAISQLLVQKERDNRNLTEKYQTILEQLLDGVSELTIDFDLKSDFT